MNRTPEQPDTFTLSIPDFAVVLLMGVSGSGKSTFAARHFHRSEILSSDAFRLMVSDDENDQAATTDAFGALHTIADIRLRRRKTVVVDATNVQPEARKPLLELAKQHDCLVVAVVLDVPERVCQARNAERADRQFGPHVVRNQSRQLRQSLRNLKREGIRYIFTLNEAQIEQAEVVRVPLWTDRRSEAGPFDLIGDVHGCYDELTELLGLLGYAADAESGVWRHPEGRRVVFLGDLVDRGPGVVETVELVRAMTAAGTAFCVPGNHDTKLMRVLKGNPASITHGLAESLKQIDALPDEKREAFKTQYIAFTDSLVSHLWLDGGRLCAAHAGMKEAYIGRASGRVREFALYGETTGETDEFGLPIRYPWAQDYRGATTVVYGHTPVPEAEWLNNTINLDTGCVFGGKLTALRWPERELVQVPARALYAESSRPFTPALQYESEEISRNQDILILLAEELLEQHSKTQQILSESMARKQQLEQSAASKERTLSELDRKGAEALAAGNEDLSKRFDEERAMQESALIEMRSSLQQTEQTLQDGLSDFREETDKCRTLMTGAGILISEEVLQGTVSAAENLQDSPTAMETAQKETFVAERKAMIQHREDAVRIITFKNNLQADLDRNHRLLKHFAQLKQNTPAEDTAALARLDEQIAALERSSDALLPDLAKASEEAERIKSQVRDESEASHSRLLHVLVEQSKQRHEQIEQAVRMALLEMRSKRHSITHSWDNIQRQGQSLRPAAAELNTPAPQHRNTQSAQWQHDELLRAEDVLGKRIIETRLSSNVIIPAENAGAALEVMSRFAVEPRWLVYLPPTMSPCETAQEGELLEHPQQAFDYYRTQGVEKIVCQRKHMGSRAVMVICRDAEAAARRFGAKDGVLGKCYTRTGRQFFDDPAMHNGLLEQTVNAMTRAGLWEALETDWICLDCELVPWNAKAQGLLREQYAPVGAAACLALSQAIDVTEAAIARGMNVELLRDSLRRRREDVERYTTAYGHYCWNVTGLEQIRVAPFHLLATEGRTYFDRAHDWHIQTLSGLAEHSPLFIATETLQVQPDNEDSTAEGVAWWQSLTEAGGEGMVVKPLEFIVRGPKGVVQPAIKVRGREYLRIIYGPEYTEPANMERLRSRRLGTKRSLALREFSLGVEGLERFVRKEPLRRIHECVFGVLALESEPVDPRL